MMSALEDLLSTIRNSRIGTAGRFKLYTPQIDTWQVDNAAAELERLRAERFEMLKEIYVRHKDRYQGSLFQCSCAFCEEYFTIERYRLKK